MIQINCEVHSTNYVKVDKKLLARVGYTGRLSYYVYISQHFSLSIRMENSGKFRNIYASC